MSIFNFPHEFKDGVGEVASGVQVMDNLKKIREWLEEHLLSASHPYVARSESLFNKAEAKSGETASWTNTTGRTLSLVMDFFVKSEGSRGEAANIYVGGVLVTLVFNSEHTSEIHSSVSVVVAPEETVEIRAFAGGGGTAIQSIGASYRELY